MYAYLDSIFEVSVKSQVRVSALKVASGQFVVLDVIASVAISADAYFSEPNTVWTST